MRHAAVTPWWPNRGGEFVVEDVRALRACGHDVRVVAPRTWDGAPRWIQQAAFCMQSVPQIVWHRPTVIHGYLAAYGGLAGWIAAAWLRWFGARPLLVVHEMACPVERFGGRRIRSRCDSIRVPSQASKDELNGGGVKANVIPCVGWSGRERQPADPGTLERRTRFLYVGAFFKRKGIDLLLDAVDGLYAEGHEVAVMFVGDGPRFNEVRARMVHGWTWVHHRPKTRAGYLAWLDWADVVVCPSREESFGVVAIEAAANGCAVIATATGEHAELAALGAARIVACDVDSLKRAMLCPPERPSAEVVSAVRNRYGSERVGRLLDGLVAR